MHAFSVKASYDERDFLSESSSVVDDLILGMLKRLWKTKAPCKISLIRLEALVESVIFKGWFGQKSNYKWHAQLSLPRVLLQR